MFSKNTPTNLCACNCIVQDKEASTLVTIMNISGQQQQPLDPVKKYKIGIKTTIEVRKEEVMAIRNRFPTKIPIIVQRFIKENNLPHLDKSKFLVPQELTMSQFLVIIRNRMRISSTQSLYLLVNNRSMISPSSTLSEVYNEYAGADGFLYVTYASQEVFGRDNEHPLTNVTATQGYSTALNSYKSNRFG